MSHSHVCFIALILAGFLGRCLNTRAIGLVFKQHSRDPAIVNARKNMCDPYSGLSILLHGVISLPDATSYDKCIFSQSGKQCRFCSYYIPINDTTLEPSVF